MKTILVPVGGGEADRVVFQTALAVASALGAHLDFLHVHVRAIEAAAHTPHVAFARGAGLTQALDSLQAQCETRVHAAEQNVLSFCQAAQVEIQEVPCSAPKVTARYRVEVGDAVQALVAHARYHDLTVMGRPRESDGLPPDRLETIMMQSGRPLLIAAPSAPQSLLDNVMVCWKNTSHAARAVSAAMPLLCSARHVAVAHVEETHGDDSQGASQIVEELRWHGIDAKRLAVTRRDSSTASCLRALAAECGATMRVMGGYSRSPAREFLFGGCTQAAIEDADVPVFLFH